MSRTKSAPAIPVGKGSAGGAPQQDRRRPSSPPPPPPVKRAKASQRGR